MIFNQGPSWSSSYGSWIYNLPMQSVPILTNVVSPNPADGEVYSIQHYAIKFVSNLRQVGGFLPGTPVSSTNKTDRHDIHGILLKVALNIITLALTFDINLYL
jgi:hypothetical protein